MCMTFQEKFYAILTDQISVTFLLLYIIVEILLLKILIMVTDHLRTIKDNKLGNYLLKAQSIGSQRTESDRTRKKIISGTGDCLFQHDSKTCNIGCCFIKMELVNNIILRITTLKRQNTYHHQTGASSLKTF